VRSAALPFLAVAARLVLLLGTSLAGIGCGECVDADRDGFGEGCDRGPDCDDSLPSRTSDCSAPAPDCDEDSFAPGCLCFAGEEHPCYPADEETLDVGACFGGRQFCRNRAWTECEGAAVPSFEQCNELDDDCDGAIDEAVRSPCGGCDDTCTGGVWGEGEVPFEPGDQLELSPRGELLLRGNPLAVATVFVPNTGDGTVSAIDPETAVPRARYRTRAERPVHVAIDYQGHAFVLGESAQGSALMHIAGDRASCEDRDGDGLETSSGSDDVLALGADECVLLDVALPDDIDNARGLSVSGLRAPDQDDAAIVWIGLPDEHALIAVHGGTGALLERIETEDFAPYAMTFDPQGTLWAIDRSGLLAAIETTLDPPVVRIIEANLRCYVLEAIASDDQGMLSLTGAECESVTRYDPVRDVFRQLEMPGVLDARGIATAGDDSWLTHTAGKLTRVQHAPFALGSSYSLGSEGLQPFDSSAVSLDGSGRLWIASSLGGPDGTGLLTRFDIERGAVTAQAPLGTLPRPEGDMTGARRFSKIEPEGEARHVFTGCMQSGASEVATLWRALHLDAVVGSDSSVEALVRRAPSVVQLEDEPFASVGTLPNDVAPFPLELPEGGAVEVQLILRSSSHHGGPRVARVGLEWRCPGPD
jgi:streptogramin lyase